jgi:hypothetical protein
VKMTNYRPARGLPDSRPRTRVFKQETTISDENNNNLSEIAEIIVRLVRVKYFFEFLFDLNIFT